MPQPLIHATAIIDPSAVIAADVEIGPYSIVGADVELGSGTKVEPHVVIKGPTYIGRNNHIFQFSSVGEACQDMKYNGEPTCLKIGDHNVIREGCTLHRGTIQDSGVTKIGNHNLLMANVHVAHDCILGDHVIVANNVGTVTYGSGVVALAGFKPTAIGDGTTNLSVTVALASSDVTPVGDQILLITNNNITVSMVDTYGTGTSTTGTSSTTSGATAGGTSGSGGSGSSY